MCVCVSLGRIRVRVYIFFVLFLLKENSEGKYWQPNLKYIQIVMFCVNSLILTQDSKERGPFFDRKKGDNFY